MPPNLRKYKSYKLPGNDPCPGSTTGLTIYVMQARNRASWKTRVVIRSQVGLTIDRQVVACAPAILRRKSNDLHSADLQLIFESVSPGLLVENRRRCFPDRPCLKFPESFQVLCYIVLPQWLELKIRDL